jgi:hypothetical protein
MGGMGIPQAKHIALAAYVGSQHDTLTLQNKLIGPEELDSFASELLALWNEQFKQDVTAAQLSELETLSVQKHLTNIVHEGTVAHLETQGDAHFRATFNAARAPKASIMLNQFPIRAENLQMNSLEWRLSMAFHFGLEVFSYNNSCINCGEQLDPFGTHVAICKGIHATMHNDMRDFLHSQMERANIRATETEPREILARFGRTNDRPADIYIGSFHYGRPAAVDIAIVGSHTDLAKAACTIGHNIERTEEAKRKKYERDLKELGIDFMPCVMESVGGMGQDLLTLLGFIGKRLAEMSQIKPGLATHRLTVDYSFQWQRRLGKALAAQLIRGN